jgi:hypothetical protein
VHHIVDNLSRASADFRKVWAIAHQAARLDKTVVWKNHRKAVFFGERDEWSRFAPQQISAIPLWSIRS